MPYMNKLCHLKKPLFLLSIASKVQLSFSVTVESVGKFQLECHRCRRGVIQLTKATFIMKKQKQLCSTIVVFIILCTEANAAIGPPGKLVLQGWQNVSNSGGAQHNFTSKKWGGQRGSIY